MHGAVCGKPADNITVYDALDGTCAWSPAFLPSTNLLECSGQIYGRVCPGFAGTLVLAFAQQSSQATNPDMQKFLNTLGLGSMTYVGQLFVISPNTSVPIAPVFLPSLTVIGQSLQILRDPTANTSIVALPGLAAVRQIGGYVLLGDYTGKVAGPLFTNLTSLAGLECVGLGFGVFQTPLVTSTAGMEKLSVVNYRGIIASGPLIVFNDTALETPAALAPLSLVANCGGGLPFPVNITVIGCPSRLESTKALCTYISSGVC